MCVRIWRCSGCGRQNLVDGEGGNVSLTERWVLYVDLEGFSTTYDESEGDALWLMRRLLDGVVAVGDVRCRTIDDRFFAYQSGDGVFLVADRPGVSVEVPLAIALALMHYMALEPGMVKISVSQGELADIQGCYSPRVRDRAGALSVRLGLHGLLTIFPVMGSAMIQAVRLAKEETGALLLLDPVFDEELPAGVIVSKRTSRATVIDWVHSSFKSAQELAMRSGWLLVPADDIEKVVSSYVSRAGMAGTEWGRNTLMLNGCSEQVG